MKNSKIELVFPNFSSSSSFLLQLVKKMSLKRVKNVSKNGSKKLSQDIHENCCIIRFWYGEFRHWIHFSNFCIFIFSQKCLKKWVKNFSLGFSLKLPNDLNLIWRTQISDSFSHIFSSSSSFLPRLIKNALQNGSKTSHRLS